MRERRRHHHFRILFMDVRKFLDTFVLGRTPRRHLVLMQEACTEKVRVWKIR